MSKIRVLLADDHTLMRQGMRKLLEPEEDIEVVGETGDGLSTVSLVAERRPDVVVLDYAMPGLAGPQAMIRIKQADSHVRVLILTMHEDEEYITESLRSGASGYILKDAASHELLTAIRSIVRGETYLSPRVSQKVVTHYLKYSEKEEPQTPYEQLTTREREVLRLLAEGRSAKEIATALTIQPKTVEAHRSNLMKKLGLHSRSELIKYAIRRKIIRLE